MDKHNPNLMTGGPCYNTYICKNYMEEGLKNLIKNERTDRYNIMCSIDAHEKEHP